MSLYKFLTQYLEIEQGGMNFRIFRKFNEGNSALDYAFYSHGPFILSTEYSSVGQSRQKDLSIDKGEDMREVHDISDGFLLSESVTSKRTVMGTMTVSRMLL